MEDDQRRLGVLSPEKMIVGEGDMRKYPGAGLGQVFTGSFIYPVSVFIRRREMVYDGVDVWRMDMEVIG